MTGQPCVRPDCQDGHIMVTGFCDTCFRKALAPPARPVPDPGNTGPGPGSDPGPGERSEPPRRPATPGPGDLELDLDGLLVLPHLPSPEPSEAADTTARPPTGGRRCGADNCAGTIGVSYDGGPAPDHGFCPECGTEYSFRPKLRPGDRVGGHYEVLGYLAVGGHGWVYLAEDTRVPGLRVVLKGLINTGDAVARRAAVEERRSLTTLHHRDIVRIVTYVQHQADGDAQPTGYIVMEYVGGRSLAWIRFAPEEELARLFGEGGLRFGHVITYGCKILGALEYLHDQGLLYCDMKPENVIHYGREIKVIDLGAIRRIDDRTSGLVYTHGYSPPKKERDERGLDVDSDLYTVGRTLKVLAERATPPAGLAARSFDALIRRATHPEPAARFGSAAEMSRQLWEVLREHQALSGHEPYPERSTRFEPTAAVFGAALGTVPSLEHWTSRRGAAPPPLPVGAPHPRETARALPVPIPDAGDTAAVLLGGLAAGTPGRIAERAERDPALRTVETALWLCRAYLAAGDELRADTWLGVARERSGDYDWRIFWHYGLVHLMRGHVERAEGEFAATYAALPGEAAPKLALGYCSEYLAGRMREAAEPGPVTERDRTARQPAAARARHPVTGRALRSGEEQAAGRRAADRERQAEEYYEAVWRRDRTQGSAAFGLARIQLSRGDRGRAVAVLDEVPTTSRHYDAARVAAIRALAGTLPGGQPPPVDRLVEAAERVTGLYLDDSGSRDRLVTELREYALACRPPGGWGAGFPVGGLFGAEDTPEALCRLLSRSLKRLADQAGSPGERGDLLDLAYAVLPEPAGLRELLRGRRRTAEAWGVGRRGEEKRRDTATAERGGARGVRRRRRDGV
ncbi:serine/threonine-protein kinase [Streptomyces sp.]|uniref:serine/threonine-protein kinase n=1 Tax=Streptomyces sp. TaxID=1931 RepID=UPI002D6CA46B|nr:tetratricopeptide repeat protein [Streptomyces sp.]HZF88750.1 tetratricopeptide repeat protein [Streptomyces sp.]